MNHAGMRELKKSDDIRRQISHGDNYRKSERHTLPSAYMDPSYSTRLH